MAELLCAPARNRTLSDAEAGGSHVHGSGCGGCWQGWLAKSRKEVEGFSGDQVSRWTEAVLNEGKVRDELIQQTVTTLQQQGVTGKSLLKVTLEKLMAAPYSVSGGPAGLLAEKIRLLKELEARLDNRLLLTLF